MKVTYSKIKNSSILIHKVFCSIYFHEVTSLEKQYCYWAVSITCSVCAISKQWTKFLIS